MWRVFFLHERLQQFYAVRSYTGGNSMNWDAIAAIGQVLHSIPVFFAPTYRAIQFSSII